MTRLDSALKKTIEARKNRWKTFICLSFELRPYEVGIMLTPDEARLVKSDYHLELFAPLHDVVIDAGLLRGPGAEDGATALAGAAAAGGAVCMAGKLNDSIVIRPRTQPAASMFTQESNGQGNSQYRCVSCYCIKTFVARQRQRKYSLLPAGAKC
jgi:hypothetical protein